MRKKIEKGKGCGCPNAPKYRPPRPSSRKATSHGARRRQRPAGALGVALPRQLRLLLSVGREEQVEERVDAEVVSISPHLSLTSSFYISERQKKGTERGGVSRRVDRLYRLECLKEYVPIAHIAHISPTPLLLTVAEHDVVTPTDLALGAYAQAREPKQLQILPGGHFDAYSGPNFERNVHVQTEFLRKYLVKEDAIGA